MEERFDILAAKALVGEASPEEQAELECLLGVRPDLRAEFDQLRGASDAVAGLEPFARALEPGSARIPEARRFELEKALRERFPKPAGSGRAALAGAAVLRVFRGLRNWRSLVLAPTAAAIAIVAWRASGLKPHLVEQVPAGFLIVQQGAAKFGGSGEELQNGTPINMRDSIFLADKARAAVVTPRGVLRFTGPARLPAMTLVQSALPVAREDMIGEELRRTLFDAGSIVSMADSEVATRSSEGMRLYSPLGATGSLTPVLWWKAVPGKKYDLIIRDEFNPEPPPWIAVEIVPPLSFGQVPSWVGRPLSPDTLYQLRITEAGKSSGWEFTFRTAREASLEIPESPAEKLLEACAILSGGSGRLGDALADLLSLPQVSAESELAIRLKALAFIKAGALEESQQALAALKARKR